MTRFTDAIAHHARRRPAALAIGGGADIDWQHLHRLILLGTRTVSEQLESADAVGLQLDYGAAACLLDLALAEAGIAAVWLPPFFTADQANAALDAAGCRAVVRGARLDPADGLALEIERRTCGTAPLPTCTARISFTSGSTGSPKGICLSIDHLAGVAENVVAHLGTHHAGRHLPVLPPGILLENVAGFFATMLAGGTYLPLAQADIGLGNPFLPDYPRLVAAIEAQAVTSLILVPEYLAGIVRTLEATGTRLPRLTIVAVGGARVPVALLERAVAAGLPVRQGYGLTECGSVVAIEREVTASGSVGHAIGANRIRIADDGEIMIEGPLYLGTIGAPRAAGPLATGDIGRIDAEGALWVEGRKSNLIVTSFGRNVSPEWIEGLLVEQPEVLQAMARGDGEAAIEALLVPARADAQLADAVARINARLPEYARIARWRVVPPFTPFNGLLTGNGRLRRAAIDAAYPAEETPMPFFDRLVADTREAQARFLAIPQLQAGLAGRISRTDYIAYLTQAYHHVRHTVPLMQEARARLGARPDMVAALDEYIAEETGHEHWILDDIAEAGGDAEAVVASDPAPATAAMVAHAYHVIRTGNPIAFFGMVYVLEGTSIALATTGAQAVQQALGLPPAAFRYLTSHGALDQSHMQFFERLMNRIDDPADRHAITEMARTIFALFGGVFAAIELEATHAVA